jgi:transposase
MSTNTRDADTRVRCQILMKIGRGESGNQAAAGLGCAPSTTSRTVARFRELGILCVLDHRNHNGELKVDGDVQAGIARILEQTAEEHGAARPTWTLEILQSVIARELGVEISVGHLWKVLRAMGVRLGQPKPFVSCPWPAAKREARLRRLRRLVDNAGPDEVVVFLDELDIHLNPKIGRDWMLPGQQRRVKTPGKNVKRYVAGAFDPVRNRMIYVMGDGKASWLFLNLLRALLAAYRTKRAIHVILDNYKIHKSEVVQAWFRTMGDKIRLHFLPPYCPDDNRIERIWKDLHDNVTRNHTCANITELLAAVCTWLDSRFSTFRGHCVGCV